MRPADEEQEARVLEERARVGIELEIFGHRRKRRRPRNGVAGKQKYRAGDSARPRERGKRARLPLRPRDEATQPRGEHDEGQRGARDQEERANSLARWPLSA